MEIPRYSSAQKFKAHFNRSMVFTPELSQQVETIISEVRKSGDKALLEFTSRFDGVERKTVSVSPQEREQSKKVPEEVIDLCRRAANNITRFHQKEFEAENSWDISFKSGTVGQRVTPLRRVGVYVPGGKAAYPSSVLMNVIPAQVAGVKEIVLVSPPAKDSGLVNELVLATAELLGIEEVYAIGGAHAVGALAYGTETIKPVDKITGPGNQYVNEAKRQVFGQVGIESLAGPSEILILADDSGNPEYIAADLLSQAEHDEQARAILISTDEAVLRNTAQNLRKQLVDLPKREIAEKALVEHGGLIQVSTLEEGLELVNYIAPEHLELQLRNPSITLDAITNAGAVFLGQFTPEPVGDYWAGSNHILPTAGAARYAAALSVRDFVRYTSVVRFDRDTLESEADEIARFARLEGLEAHARSIDVRMNN